MEKEFLNNATKFYEYHFKSQISKANKYAKKMHSILITVVENEKYETFLDNILSSKNNVAKIWVCGTCIDYDYRKNDAIDILKELSHCEDEIISRDANMLLYTKGPFGS